MKATVRTSAATPLSPTTAERLRGRFIVFDGPDGAGKSTQRQKLLDALTAHGVPAVMCQDPGGTEIGNRIRSVLLDFDLNTMDVACETLLFMASRAQLVGQIIRPSLTAGKTVLCDRFVSATCAYQGAAGYDPARIIELARFAIADCWPDVTLILDVPPDEGFNRIGRKPTAAGKRRKASDHGEGLPFSEGNVKDKPDAMESRSLDFHRRVHKLFREVHKYYPRPVVTVDGAGDENAVFSRLIESLDGVLK